jgi:hypothetical protein
MDLWSSLNNFDLGRGGVQGIKKSIHPSIGVLINQVPEMTCAGRGGNKRCPVIGRKLMLLSCGQSGRFGIFELLCGLPIIMT